MARKIQQYRGLEKDLPRLAEGQIGFTIDTKRAFIGSSGGNVEFANKEELEEITTIVKNTDSNAEIINKLTNADASTIRFPSGEYVLSGATGTKKITIAKPIKIVGDNAIIYLERGIQLELSSSNIEISGIEFRVRNHGTLIGQEACVLIRRSNIKLDRCKFIGTQFYYGVFIGDNEFKKCDDVEITNCEFDNLGYGILKQYGEGCSCHRLLIDKCRFTNTLRGDAIEINIGEDVGMIISNNYIDGVSGGSIVNAGIGIGIAGGQYGASPLTQSREGYVINNIVKNTERCAIHLEACNKFDISNNILVNTGEGHGLEIYGCTDFTMNANYIENFDRGIYDDVGVYAQSYIISTSNNYITRNIVNDCTDGINLGALGEGKTQYCVGNTVKNCFNGLYIYGKAIFTITDNLFEDCDRAMYIDYEPSAKMSLAPKRFRHITVLNNTTKFNGLPSDNRKSGLDLIDYDSVEFEGNNFVLGDFTRKPKTFISDDEPLYFVKGDVIMSIDGDVVTKKTVTSNGFKSNDERAFYFVATAGNDYIRITYPSDASEKYMLGQVVELAGAGVNGTPLVTMIKDIYIESSEYRMRLTDKVVTTVASSTEIELYEEAVFKDEISVDSLATQIETISNKINNQTPTNTTNNNTETVIEVGVGKAFQTVTSAINSINDNSANKRYKIKVFAGTYAERIQLKSYVGVEGVNRESVRFEWDRPTTTSDNDVTSHSMVELHYDGSFIRNITVKGTNFRYMVHAEFGTVSNASIEIDNCHIEHKGNNSSYTWSLPHAVGAGIGRENTTMNLKNSTFIGAINGRGVLIHDNANPIAPSTVNIEACTILSEGGNVYEGLNIDNFASYTGSIPWYVNLNNNVIQVGVAVTGENHRARLKGGGNSMQRYYSSEGNWVDSTAGLYLKNTTGETILRGTAIYISEDERSFSYKFDGAYYEDYPRFGGFAIRDIPIGGFGWTVSKGSVQVLFGNNASYLDEVAIGEDGLVVKYEQDKPDDRRLPIGHLVQPSANAGELRRVTLVDNIKNAVVPWHVMLKGTGVVYYAWNGNPLNYAEFAGQIAFDTVLNRVWIAKGTNSLNDWVQIGTAQ